MLLSRQILFFGGKGGVGKTTLAAAHALIAADAGHRTLLVSTDPAHSTGDILDAAIGPDPREIRPGLWAIEIDPAREADRYIAEVKDRIRDATPPRLMDEVERQIDIARVTPGAEESALFERFTRIMDEAGRTYDRLVFDTAPLGHTLRLMTLPEVMATWMSGLIARRKKVRVLGRMWRRVAGAAAGAEREDDDPVLSALEERVARFQRARRIMTDAGRTAFVLVVIPERLPIAETARAAEALERYRIPVGAVVVNKIAQGRAHERGYLEEIERVFARYPLMRVPLLETDIVGEDALTRVSQYIRG